MEEKKTGPPDSPFPVQEAEKGTEEPCITHRAGAPPLTLCRGLHLRRRHRCGSRHHHQARVLVTCRLPLGLRRPGALHFLRSPLPLSLPLTLATAARSPLPTILRNPSSRGTPTSFLRELWCEARIQFIWPDHQGKSECIYVNRLRTQWQRTIVTFK
jgi:hypothetical protein